MRPGGASVVVVLENTNTKYTKQYFQHFNSTGHSISDMQLWGRHGYNGTNIQRKQSEMKIIFQMGTVQPDMESTLILTLFELCYTYAQ